MRPGFWLTRPFLVAVLAISAVGAEEGAAGEDTFVRQTDLTIPASPAFTLLGVTPEQVNQPGYVRDFKLDWVLKDGGLAPNMAIEAQPVWIGFFAHTNAQRYRALPWIARTMSTLSASLGTAQHGNTDSGSVAWGARLNLYRQADPLMSETYSDSLRPVFSDYEKLVLIPRQLKLEQELAHSEGMPDHTRDSLKAELVQVGHEIEALHDAEEQRRQGCRSAYEREHWNSASADLGGGMIWDYASPKAESLHLSYAGMGLWLTGCVGIGKNAMFTAMYRLSEQRDSLHHSLGLSLRLGGPKWNGFIEAVSGFDDLGATSIGYGVDHRVSDNLLVQFGCRTALKDGITLASFQPRIKLSAIVR